MSFLPSSEILTVNGFKSFGSLSKEDFIFLLEDGSKASQVLADFESHTHNGEVLSFSSDGDILFTVTSNHEVVCTSGGKFFLKKAGEVDYKSSLDLPLVFQWKSPGPFYQFLEILGRNSDVEEERVFRIRNGILGDEIVILRERTTILKDLTYVQVSTPSDLDQIQIMATLSGHSTRWVKGNLVISHNKILPGEKITKTSYHYSGPVYSLKVPNNMVVLRNSGSRLVSLCGGS